MDKNIALLLAPLIGGAVATASSYLTIMWSQKNKPRELAIERILSAVENAELFAIKIKSGIAINSEEVHLFIASCTWFPEEVKKLGFDLAKECLKNKKSGIATEFHTALLEFKKSHFTLDK